MEAVKASGLTKLYGSFEAVRGVSFSVESGESFALIGPNGAGKTTVLRMVSGLISPSSGAIAVLGYPPSSKEARLRMSILPEDAGVYEKLTVVESVYYYGLLRGLSPRESRRRTEVLVEELGLSDKADELGSRLSKGLKRKTLLAMCLVSDPDVLVLDEPTDGLDVRSAKSVEAMIRELTRAGKSVVVTSHNMSEVNDLADSVAVIDRGQIVAYGETSELLAATGYSSLEQLFLTLTHDDE